MGILRFTGQDLRVPMNVFLRNGNLSLTQAFHSHHTFHVKWDLVLAVDSPFLNVLVFGGSEEKKNQSHAMGGFFFLCLFPTGDVAIIIVFVVIRVVVTHVAIFLDTLAIATITHIFPAIQTMQNVQLIPTTGCTFLAMLPVPKTSKERTGLAT